MEYNEILFWKVFHNKFIFNNIIEQISNIQLEYERIDLYGIGNRIKFKELQSLKVIVLKKQFQLLKCKLENNEFILYDRNSIDLLLQFASIEIIKLFIEKHRIKQQDPQLEKLNVMIDLVLYSVKNNNLDSLKYFINEFQLPIERNVFELTLKEKSMEFIDIILNSNQFKLEESTRKLCLKLILNNKRNFKELIEYIIHKRPELNYFTSKSIIEKFFQHQRSYYLSPYANRPEILDFLTFYNLKSKETKLKILEMGCVSRVKPDFIYSNKLKPNNWKDYEEIEFYLLIILKQCDLEKSIAKDTTLAIIKNEIEGIKDCGNLKTEEKCKQLHELIITKLFPIYSSHIYRDYFELYDQVIPSMDYVVTFQYTFSTFSVNGLNYLINLKKKSIPTTQTIYINEITKTIDNKNEKGIIEFLKIYFKSKQLIPQLNKVSIDNMFLHLLYHCSIETLNEILKLKSQDDLVMGFLSGFLPDNSYESSISKADEFIRTISKNKDNDRFIWFIEKLVKKVVSIPQRSFIYNYKCLDNITISTKNHIDFLIEYKPTVIVPLDVKHFEIETLELANYFQKRLNLSIPSSSHYYYLYLKSLFNGDFKTFQEINNMENLEIEFMIIDFKSIKINDQLIYSIIENINKSRLKCLSSGSKIKLFQFLLSQNEEQNSKVIDNLQFNLFPSESMVILLDNILDVNAKVSNGIIKNLVMNGEFEFSQLVNTIQQYEKKRTFTIYKPIEGKQVKNGYNAKEQLIPFIKSLFNKFEANINDEDDPSSLSHGLILKHLNFIFSYLYKLLIQCDDITLDLINDVRQFYFSNDLAITDDLFTLSCYLGLRSNQFIKYLSCFKIRLNNNSYFLTGPWDYDSTNGDGTDYTLDFNLMLKDNKATIDKDFFDVIYQTTKSNDHKIDFFKKIVFFKLRNLIVELHGQRPPPIAVEVYSLIDLNRADMVLELAEIETSQNKPFPIGTIGSMFINISTLNQIKELISIMGPTESNRIKYLLLKDSITFRKFQFIDYLIKESNLFLVELTNGSFDYNNFKVFREVLASNDLEMIEYLLKNYRGQDFQTTTTTTTQSTRSIDLFKDFQYSQNIFHNNFQATMDNGLIDMYDLISKHFPFVPKKENIIQSIKQQRYKLVEYFYVNNYLEHLGEETISSINYFVIDQYPNHPDSFPLKIKKTNK
ncbi:hypothetical protein ACTA71_006423 [Dictyostelium dimigraforme]